MHDELKAWGKMRDLTQLNNSLFAQLERLSDEDLTQDELKSELARSKGMTDIAGKIIDGGRLLLDAQVKHSDLIQDKELPKQLG